MCGCLPMGRIHRRTLMCFSLHFKNYQILSHKFSNTCVLETQCCLVELQLCTAFVGASRHSTGRAVWEQRAVLGQSSQSFTECGDSAPASGRTERHKHYLTQRECSGSIERQALYELAT